MTANPPDKNWTRDELVAFAAAVRPTGPRWWRLIQREILDHGFLRHLWRNEAEIAPGVWRSNHPPRWRLRQFKARGVRTVLTLRGDLKKPPHQCEIEDLEGLDLALEFRGMSARLVPRRDVLLDLIEVFRGIRRPFVMHCKSGADRTGLAAAIWLLEIENRPLAEARAQLSPRFLHFRWSKTGILDAVLDLYEQETRGGAMRFAEWVRDHYDPSRAEALFRRGR